jgi:hypothetical protein
MDATKKIDLNFPDRIKDRRKFINWLKEEKGATVFPDGTIHWVDFCPLIDVVVSCKLIAEDYVNGNAIIEFDKDVEILVMDREYHEFMWIDPMKDESYSDKLRRFKFNNSQD